MWPLLIEVESSGSGVGQLAGWLANLEKSVALDHYVQGIVGLGKVALGEDDLVGGGARSQTQLQSGRHGGLLAGGRAGLNHVLIQQILKLRAPALNPSCWHSRGYSRCYRR